MRWVQPKAKVFVGAEKLQLWAISTVDLGRAGEDEVFPVKQQTFGSFGVGEQMEVVEKLLDGGEAW